MPKTIAEAKVVGQRLLNSSTKLIDVYAPEIANQAVPGQFVNVQVCKNTAPLLRRPFGVAGYRPRAATRHERYASSPHCQRSGTAGSQPELGGLNLRCLQKTKLIYQ